MIQLMLDKNGSMSVVYRTVYGLFTVSLTVNGAQERLSLVAYDA